MLEGKIRDAVRWATQSGMTKVILPEEHIKTPEGLVATGLDVLQQMHPPKAAVKTEAIKDILNLQPDNLPPIKDFDVTEEDVEKQARILQGSAGPSGTDAHTMQRLLTCYGQQSKRLREQCAKRVELLARQDVPWRKIAASRACREIALGMQLDEGSDEELAMYKIRPNYRCRRDLVQALHKTSRSH